MSIHKDNGKAQSKLLFRVWVQGSLRTSEDLCFWLSGLTAQKLRDHVTRFCTSRYARGLTMLGNSSDTLSAIRTFQPPSNTALDVL